MSYLKYEEVPTVMITKVVRVTDMFGGTLGVIKWWGHWRKYCFFPNPTTLFDINCLQEICGKIEEMMAERKAERAANKSD